MAIAKRIRRIVSGAPAASRRTGTCASAPSAPRAFSGGKMRRLGEGRRAGSGRKLALAVFNLTEDLAVVAAHVVRHPPDVDGAEDAERADVDGRGVRMSAVAPPVPAVAEEGEAADVHVDTLRHVDVNVAEGGEDGDGRLRKVDGGFAQIEVEVAEGGGRDRPLVEPEPPAPRHMTEQGRGEAGRLAA